MIYNGRPTKIVHIASDYSHFHFFDIFGDLFKHALPSRMHMFTVGHVGSSARTLSINANICNRIFIVDDLSAVSNILPTFL